MVRILNLHNYAWLQCIVRHRLFMVERTIEHLPHQRSPKCRLVPATHTSVVHALSMWACLHGLLLDYLGEDELRKVDCADSRILCPTTGCPMKIIMLFHMNGHKQKSVC